MGYRKTHNGYDAGAEVDVEGAATSAGWSTVIATVGSEVGGRDADVGTAAGVVGAVEAVPLESPTMCRTTSLSVIIPSRRPGTLFESGPSGLRLPLLPPEASRDVITAGVICSDVTDGEVPSPADAGSPSTTTSR